MSNALLIVAGLANLAFGLLHVLLGYVYRVSPIIPPAARGSLETYNVCFGLAVFFLAYACLARRQEMLSTGLGTAVLALGASIYLARTALEFIALKGELMTAGLCLATGLLFTALLLLNFRRKPSQPRANT